MAVVASQERSTPTYGNWKRPRNPGLFGLGTAGTFMLFGALIVAVILMAASMIAAVVWFLVVVVATLAVSTRDRHGRNLIQRLGSRTGYTLARSGGSTLYRSGPLSKAVRWQSFQLPGLGAQARLTEHRDSYDLPFALVHVPSRSLYTVVVACEPDGASLVDQTDIDVQVADWGHWLSRMGNEPGLEGVSVTIETAPDSGLRLRQNVENKINPDANEFSRRVLREKVRDYPLGSSRVRAYVALSFSGRNLEGKKRKPDDMARELATRLPGIVGDLEATGAGAASLMSAEELAEVVRVAYDPAAAVLIDEAHAQGMSSGVTFDNAGPSAHEAAWNYYRHDSGLSRTWAMTEAPRGEVQSSILSRLLEPHGKIARKRVTIMYRPINAGMSAQLVEKDIDASTFTMTAARRAHARNEREVAAAKQTAREEASGAGLVDFGMLVTATVTDPDMQAEAAAAVSNMSAAARVNLRLMYGEQDSAFAAALPLGLNIPRVLRNPSMMREQ